MGIAQKPYFRAQIPLFSMIELLNQALYVVSGTAWSIAYIFIIIRGFRDKTYGMPFISLAFNISWEFCFATIFNDGNPVHRVVNMTWFLLDIGILITYFRYGKRDWPERISTKYFYPYSFFVMTMAFAIIYFATRDLHDIYGANLAYIMNLTMSVLYINMINTRGNLSGQSAGIAVAKLIGTLSPTIMFYMMRSKFLTFTGGLIVVFDLIYLLLVLNAGRLVWPFRLKLRS